MTIQSGRCPACQSKLQINRLSCPNCMAEYPVNEVLSPYDYLTEAQSEFLANFLRCRGNLKSVGELVGLSYPAVKRRLDQLLTALGYAEGSENDAEEIDMSNFGDVDYKSVKASAIVKRKLYEHNGAVTISLLDGKPCRIIASRDGTFFTSDKLGSSKYEFRVFDVIVDLLLSSDGGRAPKGNGHGKDDKVGYGKCTPDTVLGAIAIQYSKKSFGESTFDPVFVLAAVLDWAGIAKNRRGYMELSPGYRELIKGETVMTDIATVFENELKDKMLRAQRECKYNPSRFLQMLAQYGGVGTAKRLIRSGITSGTPSDGYVTLYTLSRLDLSMEDSVVNPKYKDLFTFEEISYCHSLLERSGQ